MNWKEIAFAQRPKNSPIYPHVNGWCKSINGKLTYIAGKAPYAEALEKYHLKMASLITAKAAENPALSATMVVPTPAVQVVNPTPAAPVALGTRIPSITVRHRPPGLDPHYVQKVKDSKVRAVINYVREHYASAIEVQGPQLVAFGEVPRPALDLG